MVMGGREWGWRCGEGLEMWVGLEMWGWRCGVGLESCIELESTGMWYQYSLEHPNVIRTVTVTITRSESTGSLLEQNRMCCSLWHTCNICPEMCTAMQYIPVYMYPQRSNSEGTRRDHSPPKRLTTDCPNVQCQE